jgi:3-methyladenine DNA glycosylase AlkD
MTLSARAKKLIAEITKVNLKLGDLKKRGAEIKQDHALAMELWSTEEYDPRLLATLIFDKKLLAEKVIDQLAAEMLQHDAEERTQLADRLLANQLAKDKKLVSLIATWEKNPSPILRRWFWYHQARLRWVGQAPPGNSADLLDSLENDMAHAEPEVQWAMNFCAGQIGVYSGPGASSWGKRWGSTRTSMWPRTARRRTCPSLSESKSPSGNDTGLPPARVLAGWPGLDDLREEAPVDAAMSFPDHRGSGFFQRT